MHVFSLCTNLHQVKVLSRGAPLVQTNTTGHMFAQSGVVERPETPASVIQRSQSVRGHDVVYSSPQQRPTTASPSLRALRGSASSSGLQRRRPQTAIVRNASHQQPRMSVTHTHASQSSNVMVITDDKEESSVVSPPPAARGAVIKHKSTRALARPMSAPAVKVNKMKQLSLSSVEPPENVNLKNQAARFWRPSLSQSIIAQRSDVPHVQKGRAQRPKTAGLLRGNNGRNVAVPHVHSGRAKSVNKTFNGATMVKEGTHYTYTYQPKRDPKDSDMVPSTHSTQLPPHYLAINIQGLKCKGCASGVTAALKRLAFVVDVQIHVYTFKRTQTAYSLHSKAQERTKEARAIDTEAYAHACDVCVDPSTNLHANVEANSMVEKTDSVCLVVGTQDMMLESSFDHVMQTVYHAGRFFPKVREMRVYVLKSIVCVYVCVCGL
jgi:copper chaperone CopZ